MDTIIYHHDRPVFTSALKEIEARTDKDTLTAALRDSGGTQTYSVELSAYGGRAVFYDPGQAIEADLRKKSAHYGEYTLTMGEASVTIKALFCRMESESPFPGSGSFLTTMQRQAVFRDTEFCIATIPAHDRHEATPRMSCVCRMADGTAKRYDFEGPDSPMQPTEAGLVMGSFEDILATVRDKAEGTEDTPTELMALSFAISDRVKTYFFRQGTPDLVFYFRNCFNTFEIMPVKALVKKKSAVSSSTAVVRHRHLQYDRTTDTTYQCTISPPTQAEADALAQLAESHEAFVGGIFTQPRQCVITDHTIETTNQRGTATAVKITFRCAESAPVMEAQTEAALSGEDGIFTPQYYPEFS